MYFPVIQCCAIKKFVSSVINVTGMVCLPGHCPMDYREVMEYAVPLLTPK
jgi:hypothetical protein